MSALSQSVLIVVDNTPARIERIPKIVASLKAFGLNVAVACPSGAETLPDYETQFVPSVAKPPALHYIVFSLFLFFRLLLRRPLVVHFINLPDFSVMGVFLARIVRRFKFVYDRQGAFSVIVRHYHGKLGFLGRIVEIVAIRSADAILVVVPQFVRELDELSDKVFFVPNGVDLTSFRPGAKRTPEEPIVSVVAALTDCEGVDVFIKAAALVKEKMPHTRFRVIGDGEYAGHLKRLSSSLGDPVEFIGWVPHKDMPKRIDESAVCVSPVLPTEFTSYAYPVKMFEYMACAKPVVASNIPGHIELVGESQSALLYDAFSPDDLAAKIIVLLKDPNLRQNLAEKSRKIAQRFSWDASDQSLRQAYATILG